MRGFVFNRYKVSLITLDDGFISEFASSMIRGSLFNCLRSIACLTRSQTCKECLVRDQCSYSFFFELTAPKGDLPLQLGDSAPHPYIIEMVYPHRRFIAKGNELNFNIILIGRSIVFLPHLIYAMLKVCEKGIGNKNKIRLMLDKIELEREDRNLTKIFVDNKLSEHPIVYRSVKFFQSKDMVSDVSIKFITPVRVKSGGKLCSKLNFTILLKNILRRLSLISMFYGDDAEEEMPVFNVNDLIDNASKIKVRCESLGWVDVGRYSSKQKMAMQLGGVLGTIAFEGDFTEFMPFLRLGEILHIGKNTSFGLGKYLIEI